MCWPTLQEASMQGIHQQDRGQIPFEIRKLLGRKTALHQDSAFGSMCILSSRSRTFLALNFEMRRRKPASRNRSNLPCAGCCETAVAQKVSRCLMEWQMYNTAGIAGRIGGLLDKSRAKFGFQDFHRQM